MRGFERRDAPVWFDEALQEEWSAAYVRLRDENPTAIFRWRSLDGAPVNQKLSPALSAMTDEHCAYCDVLFHLGSDPTIDHFCPKSRFPELSYRWTNLYPCCRQCQQRPVEGFHPELLRPDHLEFAFDEFFIYDAATGDLRPHPRLQGAAEEKVLATIEHFGLNRKGRSQARLQCLKNFLAIPPAARRERLEHFSFRFLFAPYLEEPKPKP